MKRVKKWINNLKIKYVQSRCSHEFNLEDLCYTNIKPIERPSKNSTYADWENYYSKSYVEDAHTKRVFWFCRKCNKFYYAHCGLDILSHGIMTRAGDQDENNYIRRGYR